MLGYYFYQIIPGINFLKNQKLNNVIRHLFKGLKLAFRVSYGLNQTGKLGSTKICLIQK